MADSVILVIDVGSSSTRAIFFDSVAHSIPGAVAQIPLNFATTPDGGSTIDAATLFSKIVESIDLVIKNNPSHAQKVIGVASDTFVGNLLGVDSNYQAITPVYTYADTRNASDVTQIRRDLGSEGVAEAHQRTATMLHSSYAPARLKWIARTEPEIFKKVAHWISFGEYFLWRLFEIKGTSFSVASWNGLLNFRSLTWDKEWLDYLNMNEAHLSPLTDIDQQLIGLKPPWSERWPTLKSIPWFPTLGDGAAANIGSGCDSADRIALTLGTTGAMRVILNPDEVKKIPTGLWCYRVEKDRCLLGGATTEGGNLYGWLKSTLLLPSEEQIEKELAAMTPTSHGLSVLPFILGERAPGWNENAKANIQGITLNTTAMQILQAGLESVAYRFAIIYRKICEHLLSSKSREIVIGGGSILGSPVWAQIFADVLGEPLITLLEKENTGRGTALLALEKLGRIKNTSDLRPETGKIFEPNLKNTALHKTAIEKQIEFYQKIYK